MRRMAPAQSRRHELLDFLSQQFLPRIAKKLFHLRVHQNDFSLLIDHHHRIRSRFQQSAEPACARFCSVTSIPDAITYFGVCLAAGKTAADQAMVRRLPSRAIHELSYSVRDWLLPNLLETSLGIAPSLRRMRNNIPDPSARGLFERLTRSSVRRRD